MDDYTGNPSAVQSPSPAPGPGVAPIVAIPSDGTDNMNAASIAQAMKVPADFIAWLTQRVFVAAAFINGGTALSSSIGLDGTTPFTHNSTGNFTLKLAATIADPTKVLVFGAINTITGFIYGVTIDGLNVIVSTTNAAGTAVNTTCCVFVIQLM